MDLRYLSGVIALCILFYSCDETLETEPKVSFQNENVLLPIISFSTVNPNSLKVRFWPDSLPSLVKKSKLSSGRNHQIFLMNLTEKTLYAYKIIDSLNKYESKIYHFTTGAIPSSVFKIKKSMTGNLVFNGYVLIRSFYKSGADAILNGNGDIVWYHLYDKVVRRPFHFTAQHTILSVYDSSKIKEIDLYGNSLMHLDLPTHNIPNRIHHEIFYDKDQNIVTLTFDSVQMNLKRFGGRVKQYLRADGILVLTKTGKIKWKWSLLDVARPDKTTDSINLRDSWGHANSILKDTDGNYLVSFRDFAQVWKIDSKNGEIIWKLGKGGDFKIPEKAYFIGQHSLMYTDEGELIMFDNGHLKKRVNSRILAFKMDQPNMKAEVTTLINLPRTLTAYRMSSVQKIAPDKFLVCASKKNVALAIISNTGKILWKVVADNSSYRAVYLEDPFSEINMP